jgi:hypothetical protein
LAWPSPANFVGWWSVLGVVTQCRRLVLDFEVSPEVTQSWVYFVSIRLMLRRLEPS